MHSVIVVVNGLAIMTRKTKAGSIAAYCWMFLVPRPKLWCVVERS
jgi:hypothetical protein